MLDQPEEAQLQAWQVDFAQAARPDATALAAMRQPRPSWAYAQRLDPRTLLNDPQEAGGSANRVVFLYLPAGARTPYEMQKAAEAWMASRPDEHGAPIEILFRSERLLWRPGRAVLFGTPQSAKEMLVAVAHFSFSEGVLRTLQQEVERGWPVIEADIPLTHSVASGDLRRQAHVDAMTRVATGMRITLVRLQVALETPAPELTGLARRIFSELCVQASMLERLRLLSDSIEVAEDLYELANDRLSEFRYFYREYRVEILIVVVLAAEVLVTLYDAMLSTYDVFFG